MVKEITTGIGRMTPMVAHSSNARAVIMTDAVAKVLRKTAVYRSCRFALLFHSSCQALSS